MIDHRLLMRLLHIPSMEDLHQSHRAWVEQALAGNELARDSKWTESVAVGSRNFVEILKSKLGVRAKRRRFSGTDDEAVLREPQADLQR